MKSDNKNTELEISRWIAIHKNAIETTAKFSGKDIVATAVRLYKMAHKRHDVELQQSQFEAVLERAA